MVVLDTLFKLSVAVGLALFGFTFGSIAWSAGSGVLAGMLAVAGVPTSGQAWLSLTPIVGLIGAAATVYWGPSW